MHDTGRTGWWFLALVTVVGVIPIFVFLFQRSTPTANRYGAPAAPGSLPVLGEGSPRSTTDWPDNGRDPINEVERLAELRAKGAITDAEFERMKAAVFASPAAPGVELRS